MLICSIAMCFPLRVVHSIMGVVGGCAVFDAIDFRPNRKGISKVLGELESEIMEEVWRRGSCSVRDVYEELRLKKKIAYTTVMTIMTRLAEKELLRKEKDGTAFIYHPAVSKEQFGREVTSQIIAGLVDGFGREALAQLVEEAGKVRPETLAELERVIAERKNNSKQ